jgi:hypothetical protein
MSKQDMVLVRRAIKGGWNVPEHIKEKVIEQMGLILEFSEEDRSKIGAAKVLAIVDSIDQKTEQIASPKLHLHGVLSDGRQPEELSDAELAERIRAIPGPCGIPIPLSEQSEIVDKRPAIVDGRVFATSSSPGASGEAPDDREDQERSDLPDAGNRVESGSMARGSDPLQGSSDSGTLHTPSRKKPNDRRQSTGPLLD